VSGTGRFAPPKRKPFEMFPYSEVSGLSAQATANRGVVALALVSISASSGGGKPA